MKIRQKGIIFLIVVAMIPALIIAFFFDDVFSNTGKQIASQTQKTWTKHAEHVLGLIVENFGKISNRDREAIELTLSRQVREVELRLAEKPPENPSIFLVQDYDEGENIPDDMVLTKKYQKLTSTGQTPFPVSFSQQNYLIVLGADEKDVRPDMARLSTMPKIYAELYETNNDLVTWLYTSLQKGMHSCYPGHGGYPLDYDPRVRSWYTMARDTDGIAWSVLPDVSTRQASLSVAKRVNYPDGTFAGATALDVSLPAMLDKITLPHAWKKSAIVMQVYPEMEDGEPSGKLLVLARKDYVSREKGQWKKTLTLDELTSKSKKEFDAMRKDILAGKSAVRKMNYNGCDALWAYGKWKKEYPLALVIIPYEQVISHAREMDRFVRQETSSALKTTSLILAIVLIAVVLLAIVSSRPLTRPIRSLATAAKKLSGGDFDVRVNITTKDEFAELGQIFNEMGPNLKDRDRMKQSLALAMEIQRNLLPTEPPKIDGFDIFGKNISCDETGGDYFDFINLVELGEGKLGIALGDVTGHGIGAALLMASARAALRSQVISSGEALDELFDKINVNLVRDTGDSRFMTLFYGLLDSTDRSLRWASGGHDPAMLLASDSDTVVELDNPAGIPLGVMEDYKYDQAGPFTFKKRDILFLGTDGIWEAANENDDYYGKERLAKVIIENRDKPANQIGDAIINAVVKFQGQKPQADDITLVIIKAT